MSATEVFRILDAGTPDELQRLLESEPELAAARNEAGVSALLYTLYQRKPEFQEVLFAADPSLDAFDASAFGRLERLRELIGADPACVHAAAKDGFFPLHLACFFGTTETVQLLLENDADVSVISGPPMNLRPLHSAAAVGNSESCRLLLERGANPDLTQQGGWTPLHSAAMHGNPELAQLLLDHGASVELAADVGKTALDLARDGGHEAVVTLLEANGA